jgi:hypothetical protein
MSKSRSTKAFKRIKRDHYPTHECAVDALLECVRFRKRIVDPCCGPKRQILEAVKRHGHYPALLKSDIIYGFDFTERDPPATNYDIISNPPYGDRRSSLSLVFIERSLEVVRPWKGRVAMLLPSDFDNGYTRRHVFEHPAFDATVVLQNRVRIFDERSGTTNHNWFVWDWSREPGPSKKLYNHISYGDIK